MKNLAVKAVYVGRQGHDDWLWQASGSSRSAHVVTSTTGSPPVYKAEVYLEAQSDDPASSPTVFDVIKVTYLGRFN